MSITRPPSLPRLHNLIIAEDCKFRAAYSPPKAGRVNARLAGVASYLKDGTVKITWIYAPNNTAIVERKPASAAKAPIIIFTVEIIFPGHAFTGSVNMVIRLGAP